MLIHVPTLVQYEEEASTYDAAEVVDREVGADLEVKRATRVVGDADGLDVAVAVESGEATELEPKPGKLGEVV